MNKIDNFITLLSQNKGTDEFENLYWGNSEISLVRSANLKLYLNEMVKHNPKILLLGEAPGYKGCKLTGIPFTSEYIISTNIFFENKGFKFFNKEKESTATILWGEIKNLNSIPLLWNIFPYHPFKLNNKNSNRPPNKSELENGYKILLELIKIYNIEKIIAVGRKAESTLKSNNINSYKYIRHPSNGGKQEFSNGLKNIYK